MSIYKPTRLYIKRHSVTGKRYFGKSTRQNINSYKGSGKKWSNHIKKHGREHVVTEWISDWFYDKEEIQSFALSFSEIFDIVEDDSWANMKVENGLDGGSNKGNGGFTGKKHTKEHCEYLSRRYKGHKVSDKVMEACRINFRPRPGKENTNAKRINIYNNHGVLMFKTHGDFKKTCLENKLPHLPLQTSYLRGGTPIFNTKSTGRLKDLSMLVYKGWYAIIVNN